MLITESPTRSQHIFSTSNSHSPPPPPMLTSHLYKNHYRFIYHPQSTLPAHFFRRFLPSPPSPAAAAFAEPLTSALPPEAFDLLSTPPLPLPSAEEGVLTPSFLFRLNPPSSAAAGSFGLRPGRRPPELVAAEAPPDLSLFDSWPPESLLFLPLDALPPAAAPSPALERPRRRPLPVADPGPSTPRLLPGLALSTLQEERTHLQSEECKPPTSPHLSRIAEVQPHLLGDAADVDFLPDDSDLLLFFGALIKQNGHENFSEKKKKKQSFYDNLPSENTADEISPFIGKKNPGTQSQRINGHVADKIIIIRLKRTFQKHFQESRRPSLRSSSAVDGAKNQKKISEKRGNKNLIAGK